jgi:hypothetical protein
MEGFLYQRELTVIEGNSGGGAIEVESLSNPSISLF